MKKFIAPLCLLLIFALSSCNSAIENPSATEATSSSSEDLTAPVTEASIETTTKSTSDTVKTEQSTDFAELPIQQISFSDSVDDEQLKEFINFYFEGNTQDEFDDFVEAKTEIFLCTPFNFTEKDIAFLQHFNEINLQLLEKTSLDFLSQLSHIKALTIQQGKQNVAGVVPISEEFVADYSVLNGLKELEKLTIKSGYTDFDLSHISSLKNLKDLWLSGLTLGIENVFVNKRVETLNLYECNFDIDQIVNAFPKVEEFLVYYTYQDLSAISRLTELREIVVYLSPIEDFAALSSLSKIERFCYLYFANDSYKTISDISFFKSMEALKEIEVNKGSLTDEQKAQILEWHPDCEITEYDT